MNQVLIAKLDVKSVTVFLSPVSMFVPDVVFPNKSLRKIDAETMSNIAGRQVVREDVGGG